ncbi:hypothetical protein V6N13_014161 [Hibiscus sabdariffa]
MATEKCYLIMPGRLQVLYGRCGSPVWRLFTFDSLDSCPGFRVYGVKHGYKAPCGGVLVMNDGTIRAMFSGPVNCNEFFWDRHYRSQSGTRSLKLAGPWGFSKFLAEVDALACDFSIQFRHILQDKNEMAAHLAWDALIKSDWFKAWWCSTVLGVYKLVCKGWKWVWRYSSLSGWVNSSDGSWLGHYMGSGFADLFALNVAAEIFLVAGWEEYGLNFPRS